MQVAWLRSDSKAILAIHTHMVTNNPRMSVNHNGHNSWTLNIDVVQRNDSGLYMCQINTEPMTSQVRNTYSNHFSINKTSIIDVLIIVLSSGSWCLLWRMERMCNVRLKLLLSANSWPAKFLWSFSSNWHFKFSCTRKQ